jgi:AraC-like DNA-binding protein
MRHRFDLDTVSTAAAIDLIKTCRTLALLSERDISTLGIEKSDLSDPSARFPETVLVALWQRIAEVNKGHNAGLKIGQTINPEAKGILASWVSQTSTIREAIAIFAQNISLMNASEHWHLEESKDVCTLQFSLRQDKGYPSAAIERSMSSMATWGRALTGHHFPLTETSFTFSAPHYAESFIPIFGHNITFNASANTLKFDSKLLGLPVLSSNNLLKAIIEDKARDILKEIDHHVSITTKVKGLIQEALTADRLLSIKQVSDQLAMSRQTLFRALKKEGTNYKTLCEDARKQQALSLLESGERNMTTLSLCLGYKDSSSFYKAFNRWFGMPPKAYLDAKNAELNR